MPLGNMITVSAEPNLLTSESSWAAMQSSQHRTRFACSVASAVPLLMFATVVILRGGFPTPIGALLKMAGTSLLVVNAGAFGSGKHWLLCGPMVSILTLLIVSAIGLSPLGGSASIAVVIAVAGGVACASNMVGVVVRIGFVRSGALLSLGLFLGLYAESMYWRVDSVHDVVYPESIVAGRVATDVAQQAAVINMISTYKVASTGLDGLPPLRYHTGSLWMAEAFRRLCGFRAIDFLAFGYGILLIPLYVFTFFGCADLLRAAIKQESDVPPFIFWAASVVALVGLFPFTGDPMQLNFNEMIINSDSFLLAISFSLLLIGTAVWFHGSLCARGFVWTLHEKIAMAVLLPAVLGLVGWVKISQLYLLLGLVVYLCWRVKWLRTWPFVLGAAFSALGLAAMVYFERGAVKSSFAPLNFDRIAPEWVPYFFLVYFAWAWLLLLVWARFHGTRTLGELVRAAKAGDTLLVELAFVTVIAGLIPYLLINFNSPNWKYFTEFQGVIAGVLVVALLPQFKVADMLQRMRDGSLRLTSAMLLGLTVAIGGHLFITTLAATYRMLKRGCETRAVLSGMPVTAWRQELRQIKERRSVVVPAFADRVQLIECLDRIGHEPVQQRRGTVLYIPKTNRTYWDMRQLGDGTTPFIAPALAGIPMVDGLPEYEDIGWAEVGWGYPQYELPRRHEEPTENVGGAIDKARKDGFRQLLVLRKPAASGCGLQEIPLQ
jgi:hypothetical protein